jgi:hypothetical protein
VSSSIVPLISLMFIGVGLVYFLRAERLRDDAAKRWAPKSVGSSIGSRVALLALRILYLPGYVLSFKVGGALSVLVGIALLWLWFRGAS